MTRLQRETDEKRKRGKAASCGDSLLSSLVERATAANSRASELAKCMTPGSLPRLMKMNERAHVDKLWAEAFFDGNIPWNAIGRKRFRKAVEATSRLGASYLPPTRHRLGGKLLQETYNRVVLGGEGGSVYENVVFAGGTMGMSVTPCPECRSRLALSVGHVWPPMSVTPGPSNVGHALP